MKKLFVVIFVLMELLLTGIYSFAENSDFRFFTKKPNDLPSFLHESEIVGIKGFRASIFIPGLPVVKELEALFVQYRGNIPKSWNGVTMTLRPKSSNYPIYMHMAIRDDASAMTYFHEFYHYGFLVALHQAGFDLEKIIPSNKSDSFSFKYDGKKLNSNQLDEAVAELGPIYLHIDSNKSHEVYQRFYYFNYSRVEYELLRYIVIKSNWNPELYIKELANCLEAFLKVAPKRS